MPRAIPSAVTAVNTKPGHGNGCMRRRPIGMVLPRHRLCGPSLIGQKSPAIRRDRGAAGGWRSPEDRYSEQRLATLHLPDHSANRRKKLEMISLDG